MFRANETQTQITDVSWKQINHELLSELEGLEKEIGINQETKAKKKFTKSTKIDFKKKSGLYHRHLSLLLLKLREISRLAFIHTEIKNVRSYKPEETIPPDFQWYFNTMNNITHLVKINIFSQDSLEQSLMSIERWIYILKLSHEQYDYFTACSIIGALLNINIVKSQLPLKLKSIFNYFKEFYLKQQQVHFLQEMQHKSEQPVIPMLSALASLLEKISCQEDKKYVRELSSKYKKIYQDMQTRSLKTSVNFDVAALYQFLKLFNNDLSIISYREKLKSINDYLASEKKESKLNNFTKYFLNDEEDMFYVYQDELNLIIKKITESRFFMNSINTEILKKILTVLEKPNAFDNDRLNQIRTILIKHDKDIKKCLSKEYNKIVSLLNMLLTFKNKQIILKPLPDMKSFYRKVGYIDLEESDILPSQHFRHSDVESFPTEVISPSISRMNLLAKPNTSRLRSQSDASALRVDNSLRINNFDVRLFAENNPRPVNARPRMHSSANQDEPEQNIRKFKRK